MASNSAAVRGLRIVTEPGRSASVTRRAEDRISSAVAPLGAEYRGFTVREVTLHSTPKDDLDAGAPGSGFGDDELMVFLTEMPRGSSRGLIVAELDRQHRAAVISLPALGPCARRRLVALLVDLTRAVAEQGALDVGSRRRLRWIGDEGARSDYLRADGPLHRLLLIAGLVLGNRPWRLIPTLTGLTAAAAAAASFGVFYSSIWSMANVLSPLRLSAISVVSVVLATVWLIVNNRLWERADDLSQWRARLYNTVTACTVAFGAIALYFFLFGATLVSALVVIDSGYMEQQLHRTVGVGNYAHLAWLATSMGIFAGALGSSADSYDDVLHATYGHRERIRRRAREH